MKKKELEASVAAEEEEKKASAMWSPTTTFMMEKIDGMRRARNACDVAAARDMPEGLMNAPGLASIPSKPEQPPGSGKDLGELRGKAPVFLDVLNGGLVDFLTSMGIDPESEVSALNEEGATKTFRALTMAPLKTAESCTRKMTDDYDGDHTKLCDVVRCSITRSTERELAAVLEALVDGKIKGKNFKVTVVRLKNRFVEVLFTGIRDCLLNVLVEVEGHGGHVCEIQYRNKENDAALVSYGKALKIRIKLEGEGGTNVIGTRQNIAMVYGAKGEHERALEEYEVALKLSKASSDPENGEEGKGTAIIIGNMGSVHKNMENYDKALELFKRCLEMEEKAGAEKATLLATVGYIANTYSNMGRYSEAVEWYERTLAGAEAELGKNHPQTLASVNNLALAWTLT
ncbi:hypothetical protein TeGR_g14312 [Tetraparma gracilis]|uniref:Kinesin light chain n=1 Tax=Tetraparma gracilis TaxID=2962635 RepID=A0ABQ6NA65_9STRA|nr:hypothetical protein TeGR_g14312 [Tetraparma gracilis]